MNRFRQFILFSLILVLSSCTHKPTMEPVKIQKDSRIVLIGNNLGSRMMEYGDFDTELQTRFPDYNLFIRNICSPGNTPGFRPHPSRNSPWAFPGAEKFNPEFDINTGSEGHFPTEDEWLIELKPDVILGFFGYNESFRGPEGIEDFKGEIAAFIDHTNSQDYNGGKGTTLVLISPIAFEDLTDTYDLPDGKEFNKNIQLYADAMEQVAKDKKVPFLDVFDISQKWYDQSSDYLTIDGSQLSEKAYGKFADYLVTSIFGKGEGKASFHKDEIKKAVLEKDWIWTQDFKIPNGVHAYGRRFNPFGPENYPFEIKKLREMGYIRDTAIWKAAEGESYDLAAMDKNTLKLPEVKTNYDFGQDPNSKYLYGEEALSKFHTAPGYKIDLYASEKEFPDLANPVQISFDSKGRLWVATMPSYPHYKAGDGKPNDKIIILEDTDGDGKADKQSIFADHLHLPIGFEFAPEGVYLSQGKNLVLLKDTDNDGKADHKEVILSGFDDHDTHHAHSAYSMDPSGAIFMAEGVFLHTNVETSYGPVRGVNGGFYRYAPQTKKLERVAQVSIPNPWGIATDEWGQTIYLETSGPDVRWMLPGSIKPRYGESNDKSFSLVDENHRVRPTSGLEFISSSHFPDSVQGDYLLNNTIGFLGGKQHTFVDDGTGYKSKHRQDLFWSDDKNFRPVDAEIAPDGSLYIVDWHNMLIGHMQHNARDPLRDHVHGRIYRITYPSRPLVKPAKIDGASIDELLENLKLPEIRTRYRTRTELRMRDNDEVAKKATAWAEKLDTKDPKYLHNLLEAMWATWGANKINADLVQKLLESNDYHARAAAIHAIRYNTDKIKNYKDLMAKATKDESGRVKLELIAAASWLKPSEGIDLMNGIDSTSLDQWNKPAYLTSVAHLNNKSVKEKSETSKTATKLTGPALEQYRRGAVIYAKEGFCVTCHQPNGKGLDASGFPPLNASKWVTGSEDRLIKLTLNGLLGPIEVNGKKYPGQVPMTPFGMMLNDQEIADVLTYVRNSFTNEANPISAAKVKEIRESIKDKKGFYSPEDLLKEHPLEN
ncbi:Cytochrome c552 [Sphingobacterium mizutaii]|uniref:Cytochrome c552 n=2 Tax=Sphingobacterium mizutaii TaxID=1010 RepID=A0AAJ5C1Z7_9SPHI|nr:PVC-type heme-binding CxxCH protein [Sphingobacterium mizutaii]SDL50260.1 putative membrane-bound dehydrogenase domain-containing protein [Sphingobacterium mizutaii]SNV61410.1 Cytochrome c552 [Sphingobacterium mizutaii]